jgi:cell division protein FtsN
LKRRLERSDLVPVSIRDGGGLYRVWLGPYASATEAERAAQRAIELGFERPHTVKR